MLRAQIIRICNVEMKFEDSLPLLVHFQNGCLEENTKKTKIEISVSQHIIITDIHNLSLDMLLRMKNTVLLVKNPLHIKKDFKIHDGR